MKAPAQLPEARRRSARAGESLVEISSRIEVVTSILVGGTQTRAVDEVDVIRAATVRGHLRFWWRAIPTSTAMIPSRRRSVPKQGCRAWHDWVEHGPQGPIDDDSDWPDEEWPW
jgi:hypothetical protein